MFNFIVMHQLGIRKPDALAMEEEATACPILPSSWVVGAIHWQLGREVREALRHPVLESGTLGPSVLQWAHSLKVACHPGARHSISLIQRLVALNVHRFHLCLPQSISLPPARLVQPLPTTHLCQFEGCFAVSALVTIRSPTDRLDGGNVTGRLH